MTEVANIPSSMDRRGISPDQVQTFRQNAIHNGYAPIRIATGGKNPVAPGWQRGEHADSLLNVRPESLNTGMLTAGFRCIECDVDDQQAAGEIMGKIKQHLPQGAIIRCRSNSPRVAVLYRAADGQPPKRTQAGPKGKIEVLGLGQQFVVHGQHPSGAEITWLDDRGPHNVPCAQVPAVTEPRIADFLSACATILGQNPSSAGTSPAVGVLNRPNVVPFPTPSASARIAAASILPPHLANCQKPEAHRGLNMESAGDGLTNDDSFHWFGLLPTEQQAAVIRACLDTLDNRTKDPRDLWLRVLFAVADAERLGCPEARQLALKWSRRGASWKSEDDFDGGTRSSPSPAGLVSASCSRRRRSGASICPSSEMQPYSLAHNKRRVAAIKCVIPLRT
jgi:hypothetical protein